MSTISRSLEAKFRLILQKRRETNPITNTFGKEFLLNLVVVWPNTIGPKDQK